MADSQKRPRAGQALLRSHQVARLGEEHRKVVSSCNEKIQHWNKVQSDYEALQERLKTLPDKLSYDVMVPFGPLAFMPGQLVHTNEVTVLLGDNWFAKCSAKQASDLVEHRKKHVQKALDDLQKVVKNFESRVKFTEDLQNVADERKDIVEIHEEIQNEDLKHEDPSSAGKCRKAHKPTANLMPKDIFVAELEDSRDDCKSKTTVLTEGELWARLDELERQEKIQDEIDRRSDAADGNNGDNSSSEDEQMKIVKPKMDGVRNMNNLPIKHENTDQEETATLSLLPTQDNGLEHRLSQEANVNEATGDDDDVPTIHFTHTMEPKRVRINTGRNTTLKFSEKKEEAKRKRRNSDSNGNGNSNPELANIKSPTDIYRMFVDVVNGEYFPRKSILKSRSRENSVCSDTSESSTAEFEDRRCTLRSLSYEEATYSDASECSVLEEENLASKPHPCPGLFEAFSGTVVEKELLSPSFIPHPTIAHPILPTIPEKKVSEEDSASETPLEPPKRVSKFKAARMQQKM